MALAIRLQPKHQPQKLSDSSAASKPGGSCSGRGGGAGSLVPGHGRSQLRARLQLRSSSSIKPLALFSAGWQALPYLYSPTGSGEERNEIHYASVDGKVDKILLKGLYYVPEYASGWLLVGRSGALVAQRFDPARGELEGETIQVADNLQLDDNTAGAVFSVSQSGELIYLSGSQRGTMYHVWLDASGKPLARVSEPGVYGAIRISPDGTKFAGQIYGGTGPGINVAVWDLVGGTRAQIASGHYADTPVWSPDGSTLYYGYSPDENPAQIYARPVDGSREQRVVIGTHGEAFPSDVSADGRWLLYEETIPEARQFSTLKALPLGGSAQPTVVVDRIDGLSAAEFMPSNRGWVAYQSSDSGRAEVYLTRFPNASAKYQVSPAGGTEPVWSKDGKRLYYLDANQKLSVVEIKIENNAVQTGARKTYSKPACRQPMTKLATTSPWTAAF